MNLVTDPVEDRTPRRAGLVKMLHDISAATAGARSVNQALQTILERLARELGWPLGHAFVPGKSGVFEFAGGIRTLGGPGGQELILASQAARYRPGSGWVGTVSERGVPLWITDLREADGVSDPRRRMALDLGLRGILAYPVAVNGEVRAILEFFTSEPFQPSDELLDAMAQVSAHLGRLAERLDTEQELALMRQAVATATRSGEDFFATVSRRLRGPMNAVIGMTELLLRTPMSAEQKEGLEIVRSSGAEVMSTVDDVLNFLKLEWGAVELASEPFSLRGSIEEAINAVAAKAPAKDLNMGYRLADSVPDTLLGDVGRLHQILVHLLANAVEFTPMGEVVLTVRAREPRKVESGAPHCMSFEFSVRDTGVGIAPDRLKGLFQPFNQIDLATTRQVGGTGLGLAICHRLCRLFGGELKVESEVGQGSVFHFAIDLPVTVRKLDSLRREARTATESKVEVEAPGLPVEPLEVLVVEDERVDQTVAFKMLEALRQNAEVASSGAEALAALKRRRFDMVLMDVAMPDMDGFETTRRIREEWPGAGRPYIVAMTAKAMPGDREKCLAAGMNGYVSKPVTLEDLRQALLDSRRDPGG